MLPEQSKRGRPSVACANCRAARRACDGKFADCVKYVSLPATASDAAGPSQPASPPPSRPVRSKVSPGGSEHRGAPIALAAELAYSPVEEMRDRTDQRYDLKQRRTSAAAVVAVGEQLASAGWAADAVIEEDGRTRSGQLDSKQAGGRLMELLVVAFASVSPDAPLSLQLEQAAGSLGQAAVVAEAAGDERRASRRQAGMQPPAPPPAAAEGEPLPGKALGKRKAGTAEPQADGAGGKTRAAPAARLGRPPSLAASGAASMDTVQAIARPPLYKRARRRRRRGRRRRRWRGRRANTARPSERARWSACRATRRTSAHPSLCAPPYPLTPPHPGQDDETADGETTWFATARGPEEKNESTITCGPTTLVRNHYSVPVEWVNLHELNDEFAIFKAWPSEQNRVAATHLLAVPELKWAKEEGGLFYLARSEYDLACGKV